MKSTSMIQQNWPPKTTPPYKERIRLCHRSGDKPLDPTTLVLMEFRQMGPFSMSNRKTWAQLTFARATLHIAVLEARYPGVDRTIDRWSKADRPLVTPTRIPQRQTCKNSRTQPSAGYIRSDGTNPFIQHDWRKVGNTSQHRQGEDPKYQRAPLAHGQMAASAFPF